jgi:hypothetical protein
VNSRGTLWPNMALQRTRGLVAVRSVRGTGCGSAVQTRPGRRSPLNAVALGVGPEWQT